jgi:hypothetical protein
MRTPNCTTQFERDLRFFTIKSQEARAEEQTPDMGV